MIYRIRRQRLAPEDRKAWHKHYLSVKSIDNIDGLLALYHGTCKLTVYEKTEHSQNQLTRDTPMTDLQMRMLPDLIAGSKDKRFLSKKGVDN